MNRKVLMAAGGLLAICGFVLVLILKGTEQEGIMKALPFVLLGIGCGVFGHNAGQLLSDAASKSNPEAAKQLRIEQNDERNQQISFRAKAKAFDFMNYVYGGLLLVFTLMEVELPAILLLVGVYLFGTGYQLYCHFKLGKEM